MDDSLAAVVLAAGLGTRLRPLTLVRPKALCPVGNVALVDLAIERVRPVTGRIAVNAYHGQEQLRSHVAGEGVHVSLEPELLGTAGALGHLRSWIGERDVLVTNADAWHRADLAAFVRDWGRDHPAVLLAEPDDPADDGFGPRSRVCASLVPARVAAGLAASPSGLYRTVWLPAHEAGTLEEHRYTGPFHDCGTPRSYLAANLEVSGGASVIGEGARVEGTVERCVVWPGGVVRPGEVLIDAIRVGEHLTVLVR